MRRLIACLVLATLLPSGAAADPKVVVTIKPAHSLVSAIMEGVAEPALLIPGSSSPHAYALRPSQAAILAQAEVVIRVNETLEAFLSRPIASLADKAVVLTLDTTPGLVLHEARKGGLWNDRQNGGVAREGHNHGHRRHAEAYLDPHLWLDPFNARKLVTRIAEVLSAVYPHWREQFNANARKLDVQLVELDTELRATTSSLRGKTYLVFHDAYRYFEERYGLDPAGAIAVSPDRKPGARRIHSIRKRIREAGAICVFSEPQFEPRLVATLTSGTPARRGVLDPLGAALEPGPDHYFVLMRNLAASLADCLHGN